MNIEDKNLVEDILNQMSRLESVLDSYINTLEVEGVIRGAVDCILIEYIEISSKYWIQDLASGLIKNKFNRNAIHTFKSILLILESKVGVINCFMRNAPERKLLSPFLEFKLYLSSIILICSKDRTQSVEKLKESNIDSYKLSTIEKIKLSYEPMSYIDLFRYIVRYNANRNIKFNIIKNINFKDYHFNFSFLPKTVGGFIQLIKDQCRSDDHETKIWDSMNSFDCIGVEGVGFSVCIVTSRLDTVNLDIVFYKLED